MSQGPLCPNLTKKFQKEVSQIANRNFALVMLLGGLNVNLNHLKIGRLKAEVNKNRPQIQVLLKNEKISDCVRHNAACVP